MNDWWDNGDKQIAFCRAGKGFIAFNAQYNTDLRVNLQVNMTKNRCLNLEFPEFIFFPLDSELVLVIEQNVTGLEVGLFEHG